MNKRTLGAQRFCGALGYGICALLAVAALLEFASFLALTAFHSFRPDTRDNFADASPAYRVYPWAAEFWQEEHSRWKSQQGAYAPFRIWGVASWHGKYINSENTPDGTWRRTIQPAVCDKQSATEVWMFGGSTLYGTGVPDWATIASLVSRHLNSAGRGCFLVSNFGAEGYVTNQEVILLVERLKAGRRPAMVIFYDGVNDSYAGAVSPADPRSHMSYANIKARVEGSLAGRLDFLRNSNALQLARMALDSLHRPIRAQTTEGEFTAKGRATLDNYESNLEIARALGKSYGFRVFCFWQPALVFGHKPLDPFELRIEAGDAAGRSFPRMAAVYRQAAERSSFDHSFVFLGDIFDAVRDPVYIDRWMHLSPAGNELVALALVRHIEESLRAQETLP